MDKIKPHQQKIFEEFLAVLPGDSSRDAVRELVRTLNGEQLEAALHRHDINGPLLILACAGSGKTATLTRRIIALLISGVPPENILAMTFTHKAAGEMKERVYRLLEELINNISDESFSIWLASLLKSLSGLWIATFHSVCLKILKTPDPANPEKVLIERLGYSPVFSVMEPTEQFKLYRRFSEKHNSKSAGLELDEIIINIERAKNELLPPGYLMDNAVDKKDKCIAGVYSDYQQYLVNNKTLDFNDMIFLSATLLDKCSDVLSYYRNKFKYVMIDEYQDTNFAQYVFVRKIVHNHKHLFAVGDDDQSIYGWRGADIRNIMNFKRDFPDAKIIRLEKNYRSKGRILLAANEIFRDKPPELRKELKLTRKIKGHSDYGEKLVYYVTKDAEDEANFLAYEIKRLKDKQDITSWSQAAVLYRTNKQRKLIEETLKSADVPTITLGDTHNLNRQEVVDLLNWFRLVRVVYYYQKNPSLLNTDTMRNAENILMSFFRMPSFFVPEGEQGRMEIDHIFHKLDLIVSEETIEKVWNRLRADGRESYKKLLELFTLAFEEFDSLTLYGLMKYFLKHSDYLGWIQKMHPSEYDEKNKFIEGFLSEIGRFEKYVSENIPLISRIEDFLNDINEKMKGIQTEFSEKKDGVLLVTLHSAKGLEFDNVFFAGLNEGVIPYRHPTDKYLDQKTLASKDEEEKRLFYVGITRAKDRLYLLSTEKPSPFLSLLPDDILEKGHHAGSTKTGRVMHKLKTGIKKLVK